MIAYDTGLTVTDWHGTALGTVIARTTYRGNIGRLTAITVRLADGTIWHGRHSAEWCQCVTLRPSRAAAR